MSLARLSATRDQNGPLSEIPELQEPGTRHVSSSSPDLSAGLFGIVILILAVSEVITWVTGSYAHWVFIVAGITAGLMAVRVITR